MENRCKELDFSLATEGALASSFQGASADMLTKWANLKLEVKTSQQYIEVISDLLIYSTISVDNFTSCPIHQSLVDEREATQRMTKDLVHLQG